MRDVHPRQFHLCNKFRIQKYFLRIGLIIILPYGVYFVRDKVMKQINRVLKLFKDVFILQAKVLNEG